MNRTFARLATLTLAIPFTIGIVAGAAQAEAYSITVLPGCWGGGDDETVVCDLTLTAVRPDLVPETVYVRVCLGTCQYYPVSNPTFKGRTDVCYSYRDGADNAQGNCFGGYSAVEIGPVLVGLLPCSSSIAPACVAP